MIQPKAEPIPAVDVSALFLGPSPARDLADRQIFAAAGGIGFMTVHGFPGAELLTSERRAGLLKIFALPDREKQKLLRWNFDPSNPNYYRGWFPLSPPPSPTRRASIWGPTSPMRMRRR